MYLCVHALCMYVRVYVVIWFAGKLSRVSCLILQVLITSEHPGCLTIDKTYLSAHPPNATAPLAGAGGGLPKRGARPPALRSHLQRRGLVRGGCRVECIGDPDPGADRGDGLTLREGLCACSQAAPAQARTRARSHTCVCREMN